MLVLTASASNDISTYNNRSDLSVSRDSEYIFRSLWVSCLSKNFTVCVFVSLRHQQSQQILLITAIEILEVECCKETMHFQHPAICSHLKFSFGLFIPTIQLLYL